MPKYGTALGVIEDGGLLSAYGKCVDSCVSGLTNCSGYCANTQSDNKHCGGCDSVCDVVKYQHATIALCAAGDCKVFACESGYVPNPTNKECIVEDSGSSEPTGCTDDKECSGTGWASGKCESGVCKAVSCSTGYYLDEGACKANDNANCGSKGYNCATNIDNADANSVACINGVCKVFACESDLVPNLEKTACIEDNEPTGCTNNNDCTGLGWATGICESGVCKVGSCTTGYYLDDGACKANDNANCGSKGNNCADIDNADASGVACMNGVCKVFICDSGFAPNNDKTGCVESDVECYTMGDCGAAKANSSWSCTNNQCILTCSENYADCDGEESSGCEIQLHTNTNCTACNDKCNYGTSCKLSYYGNYSCR